MIQALKILLEGFSTPSLPNEPSFTWLTIGLAHAFAGLSVCYLLDTVTTFETLHIVLAIAGCYLVLKEFRDVEKGGNWIDGVVDTCFVTAGASLMITELKYIDLLLFGSILAAWIRAYSKNV